MRAGGLRVAYSRQDLSAAFLYNHTTIGDGGYLPETPRIPCAKHLSTDIWIECSIHVARLNCLVGAISTVALEVFKHYLGKCICRW